MLAVVIGFLFLSLLLYLLLGGADFGAGILELFTAPGNRSRTRRLTYRVIGPVWEANHMWLIIFIVILFVAFPKIYTTMSVYLHIPLLLMLLGIILRGTAFIFRHYDAVRDGLQVWYNRIFVYSSFLTPLLLGMIAGALLYGRVDPAAETFAAAYLRPWVNLFCLYVGLFTVSLCAFLASVYLIGEARNDTDRRRFVRKAVLSNVLALGMGALVFLRAHYTGLPLWTQLFGDPVSRYALLAALLSLAVLWVLLARGQWRNSLRFPACFQVAMILFAVAHHYFPDIMVLDHGAPLSLLDDTAPAATLRSLGWALLAGSVFILPFLGYLFYSFQYAAQAEVQQEA